MGELEVREDLTIQVPQGFPGLLHQKEGWLPATGIGLPSLEFGNDQELVPDPPDP